MNRSTQKKFYWASIYAGVLLTPQMVDVVLAVVCFRHPGWSPLGWCFAARAVLPLVTRGLQFVSLWLMVPPTDEEMQAYMNSPAYSGGPSMVDLAGLVAATREGAQAALPPLSVPPVADP